LAEITNGAPAPAVSSNLYIEQQLQSRIADLGAQTKADVITYVGPLYNPLDDLIRYAIEAIDPHKQRLCVVLETEGGQIETAERIANTFRHFYPEVWFVIPNFAMSAGTVLTMFGDRIFMDYYSNLGPIDPQIAKGDGFVPALGYLGEVRRIDRKIRARNPYDSGDGVSCREVRPSGTVFLRTSQRVVYRPAERMVG
jgi:ClpP class serine protease